MYGQYQRSVDSKNRIALPSKLRDALGSKFYLTIGMENVIELRSVEEFDKLTADLTSQSLYDKNARLLKRWWLGNTHEIELDSQSRFVIPKSILTKGAIQKDVVFIGVGDSVELWATEIYEEYESKMSVEDLEMAAQALAQRVK
ncbi:division/cell wall cluster transcriptional repressor MraZ [Mycoplasma sp. ES3157-GEN-MYC]|uniref:Transcriptional regulator MraZ n=1 Tax=Mycoplasma miroungigenitalium TaxID=754515 RepID=A0A6M4JC13_9MOLU|nr:division/cell wall cluster transcriptional repressor MraZ [Mycoplasma miroungigenitalium]MBU4690687.1 division/cell wall cluster transcriptional repressor MraZ [Mycoplasma miroungigenitalium]MBU4691956.1 division/cell wall cluster transcriptional repressor MraZ [Mycoplasma miroungigenitalium]QJR43808.1 division/cell wall cluster transcriptional repressor MraZ [Mycoplasma miroungigenitalium]